MDDTFQDNLQWIEREKGQRPFIAGALAYAQGLSRSYGCHFDLRSTGDWARDQYARGWDQAERDDR